MRVAMKFIDDDDSDDDFCVCETFDRQSTRDILFTNKINLFEFHITYPCNSTADLLQALLLLFEHED